MVTDLRFQMLAGGHLPGWFGLYFGWGVEQLPELWVASKGVSLFSQRSRRCPVSLFLTPSLSPPLPSLSCLDEHSGYLAPGFPVITM